MTGGGTYAPRPPTANFFALSFLIDFFSRLLVIENVQFAVQQDIFQKKIFFYPTTTYSRLCNSEHTCMKILFLAGFLTLGVISSEKILRSVGHLKKLCKLFLQALIYLKGAMLIYRLMPP